MWGGDDAAIQSITSKRKTWDIRFRPEGNDTILYLESYK